MKKNQLFSRVNNDGRTTVERRSTDGQSKGRYSVGMTKLLFTLSILLSLGVGQMWGGTKRVYCQVTNGDWKDAGAKVNVHYWGDGISGTTWPGAAMTATGTANVYYKDIPDNATFCFCRTNPAQDTDWGHKTGDLSFPASPASGLNLYEITGSGSSSAGQWANIGFESTGGNDIKFYDSANGNQTWDISSASGASATKDLGTITSLYLKGWDMKMYQNMDAAIVDGTTNRWLYYNVHRSAVSPGVYSSKTLDEWNLPGWDGGYRKPYGSKSCDDNLLTGLGSGIYSMTFYLQHNGLINFYLNNGGTNYNLNWTIGVPAMATHVVTSDGTGTGASATPFNMAVGSTLTISVSGTQASSDANSVLYVSFDNGSTYSATTTKSISITNTTKYSVHIKAKYYNSADDLSGTVYDFGDVYYQGTQTPSLAISSFTQDESTVTAANSGTTVTINASRQNAGSATITYAYSTDNSNWTTIASTTSTTQSWTLPAVTSTTTYYVKASMTYESTGYNDTENFKVYGKKTIKVKNTNGWYPFNLHRWDGDISGTAWPGSTSQVSDYGTGQWKEVVLYSSNDNFIFVDGTNTNNKNSDQTYAGVTDGACYEIASGTGVVALNSTANCPAKPSLTTTSTPSANNYTTATIAGNISSNGNDNITDYGFYWGTSSTPGTKEQKGTSNYTGGISHDLTSLTPGTTYYYRAYAVNGQGETLGTVYSFKSPYKVTIDKSTGCSSISPSGTQYTSGSINLTADAATGYTFSAWSKTNGDLSNAATPSAGRNTVTFTPTADNATITATYTENSYDVTLSSTSGGYTTPTEGTVSVKQVTGTSISATPDANFVFTGWTHTGGGITKTSSATTTPNTFKATTTGGTITANFADEWNVKGGDNTEDEDDALGDWDTYNGMPYAGVSNTFSKSFSLQAKTTYHFKVVKRGNAGAADVWYGVNGGKTLTRGSNSVTGLEANGDGEEYITFTTDAAGSYTITYVYNASDGSMQVTVGYPTAYTVTFGAGTINGSNSAISVSPSFTSGDYVLPETDITFSKGTTKSGYAWKGWYSNVGGTGDAWSETDGSLSLTDTRSGNISVYACYNFVTYNITYNLNGGSGASDRTYNVETSTITLPTAPTVNRTGYTFGGWYDNSSFTGSAITQIAKGSTGNKEFWAKWTANDYTITLKPNGGSGDDQELTATFDTTAPDSDGGDNYRFDAITNPTKTGYTFRGWNTEADTSGTIIVTWAKYYEWNTSYVDGTGHWIHDGDVVVFAMWKANQYTVTLSQEGEAGYGSAGTGSVSATYDASMPAIASLPTPAPGYTFMGYFTSAGGAGTQYYDGSGASVTNWNVAENTTLHAYFKKTTIMEFSHPSSIAKAETAYLTVNPTLDPASGYQGYISICWSLLYADTDNPVDGAHWSVAAETEGGTKPNQVKYTLSNLENGSYKVQAVLKANGSSFDACSTGTELQTATSTFRIIGDNDVTVKYIDNADGKLELAAASTVTIPAGESVDVTASNIIGYTFHHWILGDGVSCENGTVGDNNTQGDATITISATYDAIVKAIYNKKKMVYFNNTVGWDTVFVYFYNSADGQQYWDNSVGAGACKNQGWGENSYKKPFWQMNYSGMKRVAPGSNIWYCDYLSIPGLSEGDISANIAFAKEDQACEECTTDATKFFYNTEAIFRGDFNPTNLPMYVPLTAPTTMRNSSTTKYYDQGYWMNYPNNSGYSLKIFDNAESGALKKELTFPFSADTKMPISITTDLEGGKTYGFKIVRADGNEYGNNGTMTNGHSGDGSQGVWEFKTGKNRAGLTTSSAGDYKFTLSYGLDIQSTPEYNYLVGVHYPEATGDFRVQYKDAVHTNWLTSVVIPAGTVRDTVSYFVRTEEGKNPYIRVQKCTATYDEKTGTTVEWNNEGGGADILPDTISADGVYNFIFTKSAGALVLEKVEPYKGNFYIRVDGAGSSNWDNFRASDHMLTYSDYAEENENFTHYFAHWYDCSGGNKNIKFVIANDYSVCVSDTLARETATGQWEHIADYIDEVGNLNRSANIRFMYNYKTNAVSRAFIDGAYADGGNFLKILAQTKDSIYAAAVGGEPITEITFKDNGNWIYEKTVYAQPGAHYKLRSLFGVTDGGKHVITQYFKGGAGTTSADSAVIIGGTGSTRYKIRLLYDFKTNRVITAYMPQGTIGGDMHINADIMFLREHQGDIEEVDFTGTAKIDQIKNIYCGIQFNKWTLNNRSKADGHAALSPLLSRYERDLFYVSFPFDVKLSDVIGFGTYGQHWIIEYYDGAGRAANGFWADTPTFWRFVTPAMKNSFTLKAGTGYIVALDLDELWYKAADDHSSVWDNTDVVELLFPGNVEKISNTSVTYTMPEHTYDPAAHPTHKDDRSIKDSHWNVMGVPTYHNLEDGVGVTAGNTTWTAAHPNYIYTWNSQDNSLTPTVGATYDYKAMHAYIVQYCGDVTFNTSVSPAVGAPNRNPDAPKDAEYRLELRQNGQMEDQTFVSMTNDEEASVNFVFGEDMSKEFNKNKANIYTFIGTEQVAGNTLPMTDQTTVVPVGVKIAADGDYTFSIPEGTNGVGVTLIDTETGVSTPLSALDYTINLSAGTYDNRFVMEISPVSPISTDIENSEFSSQNSDVRKVMIDQILYIVKDGVMYDARGARVQ